MLDKNTPEKNVLSVLIFLFSFFFFLLLLFARPVASFFFLFLFLPDLGVGERASERANGHERVQCERMPSVSKFLYLILVENNALLIVQILFDCPVMRNSPNSLELQKEIILAVRRFIVCKKQIIFVDDYGKMSGK